MKNLALVFILAISFSIVAYSQSKECCSKEKSEGTKVEKCDDKNHTMKTSDNSKTTTTTTTALTNEKQKVEKEVITKVEKKENCSSTSTCCDGKKVKDIKKVEKEVEKKEVH